MNRLTNVFKLLSDETRLRMLILLYQEELRVCELSGILDVPQPRISQNLAKFRDMNIVKDERKEKYIYYTLTAKNRILSSILKDIISDMDSYPTLVSDRNRLAGKEIYISRCSNKCV